MGKQSSPDTERLKALSKIKALALSAKNEDVPVTLAHIVRLCIDAGAAPPADRNWTEDASHENGNYECRCCECDQSFIGHKRRVICKACSKLLTAARSSAGSADVRFINCDVCQTEGRIYTSNGGPDEIDNGPCPACNGECVVEVETEPCDFLTECPSCKQRYENGGQCAAPVMRGGCPMGGDF